jgi:hypothetical protein
MNSQVKTFAPKTFIQDFIPEPYQKPFREHLQTLNVPLTPFRKDLEDIQAKLKRRSYQTTRGGIISVPDQIADIVEIRPEDILVKDTVAKVK